MLLAWLPMQAAAMPWLAFQCDQRGSGMHHHAMQHAGHAHDSSAGDQSVADVDDPDGANAVHTCCHHFSGVAQAAPISAGVTVAESVAPHSPPLLYDFIPDLLKRPPLAHLV